MRSFIRYNPYFILLLIISFILISLNYEPGSFISGWDTLHPEFNISEYLKRIFFGSYQPHQGLGAVSSQAHAAELFRIIFMLPVFLVFPLSLYRYTYFTITILGGVIGMYFLLHYLFPEKAKQPIAFLGSSMYLLNLGALQNFFNPLEMFPTKFATLPWLFLLTFRYIQEGKKSLLLLFSLVVLLAAPIAHTATLWYVFFAFYSSYFLILATFKRAYAKRTFILIFILIILNLFWILPNLYYIFQYGSSVQASKIHSLFTEEAFAKNVEFSSLLDIAILKSFPFDWGIHAGDNQFEPLLKIWIEHLKNPLIPILGYGFFIVICIGALHTIRQKTSLYLPFLPLVIISIFILLTTKSPISFLFIGIQENVPLFKEALRFPFTKISIFLLFCYALYFAAGLDFILGRLSGRFNSISKVLPIAICALLIIYMFPAFQGNFINPYMKVRFPQAYFEMFSWFQKQPDKGRVAMLPVHSFWGWDYYSWGYQGAGFSWFGIPNPITEREFDRWSPYNEQFYREISYAVYSRDSGLLDTILRKYDATYLIFDTTIIAPGANPAILYHKEIKQLLSDLRERNIISKPITFGNSLYVYKTKYNTIYPLKTIGDATTLESIEKATHKDSTYATIGNYITTQNSISQHVFPLRGLVTSRSRIELNKIVMNNDSFTFILPRDNQYTFGKDLHIPTLIPADTLFEKTGTNIQVEVYPNTPFLDGVTSVSPIVTTLPLMLAKQMKVSINSVVFDLSNLQTKVPLVNKKAFLSNSYNVINLFDVSRPQQIPLLTSTNPLFFYCDYESDQASLIAQLSTSRITLSKKPDARTCIHLPLSLLKPTQNGQDILLTLSFLYKGTSDISTCIKTPNNNACTTASHVTEEGISKKIDFIINGSQFKKSEIIIELDPRKENTQEVLDNLFFELYYPSSTQQITSDVVKTALSGLASNSFTSLEIPRTHLLDFNHKITSHDRFKNDCRHKGQFSRKTLHNEALIYTSTEGSFCDHFSYHSIPHSLGYLVTVRSENTQGLPLNICITNTTSHRCDLYEKLSSTNKVTTDTFFIPPLNDGGIGYDVNIENVGIKGSPAQNKLYSISFTPFPYDLLETITSTIVPENKRYTGVIASYAIFNPLLFEAHIQNGSALLNLSYSFDQGFKAYRYSCPSNQTCFLKALFAPFFATEIKNHVLVNNWSNGWIVEKKDAPNTAIAIVFLPQYLQYLGLIIVFIYFSSIISFYLLVPKLKNRKVEAKKT